MARDREIRATHRRPREMSRDEDRIQSIHQCAQARQMDTINAVGAADGDADGVNRDRVIASKIRQRSSPCGFARKFSG